MEQNSDAVSRASCFVLRAWCLVLGAPSPCYSDGGTNLGRAVVVRADPSRCRLCRQFAPLHHYFPQTSSCVDVLAECLSSNTHLWHRACSRLGMLMHPPSFPSLEQSRNFSRRDCSRTPRASTVLLLHPWGRAATRNTVLDADPACFHLGATPLPPLLWCVLGFAHGVSRHGLALILTSAFAPP